MSYSTHLSVLLATLVYAPLGAAVASADSSPDLDEVLEPTLERMRQLSGALRGNPVSPTVIAQFENDLQQLTQELGRVAVQWTFNQLEPASAEALPPEVH